MLRHGFAMVIWSYLLLGLSARGGGIEDVLAPVTIDSARAATTNAGSATGLTVAEDEQQEPASAQPLVATGADELDLLAELERQLADKLQPAGLLRLIPLGTMPRLRAGAALPEVELLEYPSRLASSSVLLRFRLREEDRPPATFAVGFRAQVIASVWMPLRRLTPGDSFDPADLAVREVDLVREPRAVPAEPDVFERYELVRAVAPERPLTWTDLAPRSLVRKGQVVEVVASEGLLSVSMKGQATRSGALGEIVTIRNLESKREFSAEVIDENKVRVHF